MITIEDGIRLGSSTQRLMRRLSMKNYDVVIRTRRPSNPSSSEVMPRQLTSAGRPNESLSSSHSTTRQVLLVTTEPGALVVWDKSLTLKLKSWLNSNLGLTLDHLVRANDLGLKTAKGVRAVGVILTASHTTKSGLDSVRLGSVLVISTSHWSVLQTEIMQYAKSHKLKICILDLSRNFINFI